VAFADCKPTQHNRRVRDRGVGGGAAAARAGVQRAVGDGAGRGAVRGPRAPALPGPLPGARDEGLRAGGGPVRQAHLPHALSRHAGALDAAQATVINFFVGGVKWTFFVSVKWMGFIWVFTANFLWFFCW